MYKIRQSVPKNIVLYTEETLSDVSTQFYDGSFTYQINQTSSALSAVPLNLTRFALPGFKTFEILVCDKPVGDDIHGIKLTFFNGEGLWIEGTLPESFTPKACETITRAHQIQRKYYKAFCCLNPIPLVPTLHPEVYANKFTSEEETVWTIYNANDTAVRGELLEVESTPGDEYYDVWNNKKLIPRTTNKKAWLSLEIGPRDVGCVVKLPSTVEQRIK
jgi:hypothetical protein